MQCVNCHQELNGYGNVCPFCHGSPSIFGSSPYNDLSEERAKGKEVLVALITAPFKIVAAVVTAIFKKRLGPNETTYLAYVNTVTKAEWWKCSQCGTKNATGDKACDGCKKTFVGHAELPY